MEMIQNFDKAIKNIHLELEEYILKSNIKSIVLGLSGGIDSTLCAALASDVCKKVGIPLICRSITIQTNKPDEIERANLVGKCYADDYKYIDLTSTYELLHKKIVEEIEKEDNNSINFKIRLGNIKARMRMIYLYELASKFKGMVLSTDNLTELLLGFWTLHGDVGDYGMIQQLWKTEVYRMSRYIAQKEQDENKRKALLSCINAVPTDGLGISNSDLDQLQASNYEEVDKILIDYIYNKSDKYLNHPVIQRHLKSEFKRNNPFNLKREIYFR